MATMKDIARLAKVSTSTVSHVLNNNRYVSEEVRAKVMAVVEELHYQPSALARSFKLKKTQTIGLLVTASNNPFFAEVVSAVERYCSQQNYNLILSNTEGDVDRLQRNLQTLIQKQVDGLLLMCSEPSLHPQIDQQLKLPTLIMDWWPTELKADKIFDNAELGGYLATKTLLEQGHQKIAIINGDPQKSIAMNRLNGYKRALNEQNIPIKAEWIVAQQFNFQGGIEGMEKILQLPTEQRPTAIFACCDSIAMGVYQTAWRQGLRIPQDISVIGYDDIELAKYMSPPLSTVHQHKNQLAKLAVQTLIERIQNPEKSYRTLVLEPQVVMRESVQDLR